MGKVFIQGAALAIAGILAVLLDGWFGLGLGSVLFGLAVGGILGIVAEGGPVGRIGAFLIGVLTAMVVYVVRVLFLNDSSLGLSLAVLIALVVIVGLSGLTANRLPLWAGLLGLALVTGAYETSFVAAPQNVTVELLEFTTMALVPAALAFLAVSVVGGIGNQEDSGGSGGGGQQEQSPTVSLSKSEG
jgi:hypothetical protein